MLRFFDRFRRNASGNVAITFGLMMMPIIGMVGAAIDYSNASRVRTSLMGAADAASVGSLVKSSNAMAAAAKMPGDGPIPDGVTEAINIFNAHIAGKSGFTINGITAKVEKSKNVVTSTVQFTADVPTYILGVIGKKTFTIGSTSTAANGMPPFIDFYLLLDNSPSMGVAATPADIDKMVKNTGDKKCAFACHELSKPEDNYYKLAKKIGVTMRIDVLRTATEQLMDTAKATQTVKDQFRMAIYTLGSSCTNPGLDTITSLTDNLANAKAAAKNIDLMTIPYQNYNNDQCTNFDKVMTDLNKVMPSPGNGTSASSPQKFVFFVSDGVADFYNPGSCSQPTEAGRCQEPIDLSFCTAIKNRGIKIAVLYTTYLPLPTNDYYNEWIAPFAGKINPAMQSCASSGLFFEVSPSEGIPEAMDALFHKALAQARLTK
jgi:Flp pilus assembly protein TadG